MAAFAIAMVETVAYAGRLAQPGMVISVQFGRTGPEMDKMRRDLFGPIERSMRALQEMLDGQDALRRRVTDAAKKTLTGEERSEAYATATVAIENLERQEADLGKKAREMDNIFRRADAHVPRTRADRRQMLKDAQRQVDAIYDLSAATVVGLRLFLMGIRAEYLGDSAPTSEPIATSEAWREYSRRLQS